MRKYVFTLALLCSVLYTMTAQVGVGTSTPSDAAMMEVSSTVSGTNFKGFMPPRVDISERDMIPVVAADVGLMVFVDDPVNGVQCLQYYDGATWRCLGGASGTRTVVAMQDFETVPATPTLTFVDSGAGAVQTGTGGNPVSNLFVSGSQGYGVNQNTATLDFAAVDLTSYTSGTLEVRLAAFSTTAATNGGIDNGDFMEVFISTDGGATFSKELRYTGTANALYDFTGTGVIESLVDEDNNETMHDALAGGGLLTGIDAQATVQLLGIPNDNDVVIRIVLTNNGNRELWVIDDVVLYGN